MNFIFSLIWAWVKDSQFHKTAASAAAGTSIGIMTVIGVVEQRTEELKKEIHTTKYRLDNVEFVAKARKELVDERFQETNKKLDYVIRAIDVTNQNVLKLANDKRNK